MAPDARGLQETRKPTKRRKEKDSDMYGVHLSDWGTIFFCKNMREPCSNLHKFEILDGKAVSFCKKALMEMANKGSVSLSVRDGGMTRLARKAVGCDKVSVQEIMSMLTVLSEAKSIEPAYLDLLRGEIIKHFKLKTPNRETRPRIGILHETIKGYVYKQQASQRGGLYWYMHRQRPGKKGRSHYLGKITPSFNPFEDLKALRNNKRARQK